MTFTKYIIGSTLVPSLLYSLIIWQYCNLCVVYLSLLTIKTKSDLLFFAGGLRAILTDQNKLVVAVGGVTALAAGIYTTRYGLFRKLGVGLLTSENLFETPLCLLFKLFFYLH